MHTKLFNPTQCTVSGSCRISAADVPLKGQHGAVRSEWTVGTIQAEVGTRDGGARRVKRTEAGKREMGKERRAGAGAGAGSIVGRVSRSRAGEEVGVLGKQVMGCCQGTGALGHHWVPAVCAGLSPWLWGDARLGAGWGCTHGHMTKGRQPTS